MEQSAIQGQPALTAIERLAGFVTTASPDTTLEEIIAPAVADCFGCILNGAKSDIAGMVRTVLSDVSAGPSPAYGSLATFGAPHAAQANAVAGHAWELDDWEEPGNTHPTVVLLPAILATSTLRHSKGAEALAAYAVGAEVIMQLGEAMSLDHYARGFHSSATLGTIGAAAAVARLLGANAEQTAHALSLSVSQAIGYTLQIGSNAKPLQTGWAARNGVEAVLLAMQGLSGQLDVLDHPRGFAGLLGEFDAERFDEILGRLGSPWALSTYGLVLKPWPSCGYTHRLMTAALELRVQVADRLSEVARIQTTLPDFHAEILQFGAPKTRADALFSIPACVAQILVTGNLSLEDSAQAFWTDDRVARLMSLTDVEVDPAKNPDLNYDPDQPDNVRITFQNGDILEAFCAYPLGAAQNPMRLDQLGAKYAALTGQPQDNFETLLGWSEATDVAAFFKGYDNGTA